MVRVAKCRRSPFDPYLEFEGSGTVVSQSSVLFYFAVST